MATAVRANAEVKIVVYNKSKYEKGSEKAVETIYRKGLVRSFEVVRKSDVEIVAEGFDEVDPNGEYLILTLDNGQIATFRNSLVDMFAV